MKSALSAREIVLFVLLAALLLRELLQLRRKKWFVQWLSSILLKPKPLESPKIR